MLVVVSDTTPLNYLILVGAEHVLPVLYGPILVPSQVVRELLNPKTPVIVRTWAERLPDWVRVREGDGSLFPDLDLGEAAALALAVEEHADAILADDTEARTIARSLGLIAIGTVGVLAEAHKAGLIDFDDAVKALRRTSIHVHDDIIAAVRSTLTL